MSSSQKWRFAAIAFVPVVLFGTAMVLDVIMREQGDPNSPLAVDVLAVLAVLVWLVGLRQATNHVRRRDDLTAEKRRQWTLAILFFFPITIPLVWFKLVRPLPERPSDTVLRAQPHPMAIRPASAFGDLATMMPRWYWTFAVIFGLCFTIFIAFVGHPLMAIIPAFGVIAALAMRSGKGKAETKPPESYSTPE